MHTTTVSHDPGTGPGRHDLLALCTPAPVVGPAGHEIEAAVTELARTTPFVHRQLRLALQTAVAHAVPLAEAIEIIDQLGPFHLVDALARLPHDADPVS